MKKIIITGTLALAAAAMLTAQQPPAAQTGQAAPAAPGAPAPPRPKSPEEVKALQALFSNQDPDAMIKGADEFLKQYSDSAFREQVLTLQAEAYRQKGDWMKAQIAAEDALKLNPKAIQPNLLWAEVVTSHTGERDLDRNEKIAGIEQHLNTAVAGLNGPKINPQMPDEQWAQVKKVMLAQVSNDFGMLALVQKNYEKAIAQFKEALAGDPEQGAYEARLASSYQAAGKNDEAIAECDKMLANPQLHPAIKQFVTNVRATAVKAKGGAQPAPAPAAPPAEKK